jgi:alkaline phosphatase
MDPNDQDKSDGNTQIPVNQPSVDGFISPRMAMNDGVTPSPNMGGFGVDNQDVSQQLSNALNVKSAKVGKGSKVALVIFVILFIVAGVGAGYFYMQYGSTKKDLDTEKVTTQSLRTQLTGAESSAETTTTQSEADLQVQVDYAASLSAVATQLKTLCGTACASVVIPVLPTPTPTPTPTSTPTPSILNDI